MKIKYRDSLKTISREVHSEDYILGCEIGEYIVERELPTLSTDMLQSNVVIEVSEELSRQWKDKVEKLHKISYRDLEGDHYKQFYKNLAWYKKNIENLYLEDEIKVEVPPTNPSNLEEFIKGVEGALWGCDLSHYSCKSVKGDEHKTVKVVVLTRNIG